MSEEEVYRYTLERDLRVTGLPLELDSLRGVLLWVMLNPSTATADVDDQTIRKVKAQTRKWGFAFARVVNLYAYRATKPAALWEAQLKGFDVVGPQNNFRITEEIARARAVCCGWGRLPKQAERRALEVLGRIWDTPHQQLLCMGRNGDGSPVHPCFAPYIATPVVWKVRKAAA